jgi:hypothetical protein
MRSLRLLVAPEIEALRWVIVRVSRDDRPLSVVGTLLLMAGLAVSCKELHPGTLPSRLLLECASYLSIFVRDIFSPQ